MVAYKSVYCTLLIVHTKSHRMHIHYWQNEMLIYKYRILYCECLIARFSLPSEKSNAILSPIAAHFPSAFDTVSCALPIDRGFQPSALVLLHDCACHGAGTPPSFRPDNGCSPRLGSWGTSEGATQQTGATVNIWVVTYAGE